MGAMPGAAAATLEDKAIPKATEQTGEAVLRPTEL